MFAQVMAIREFCVKIGIQAGATLTGHTLAGGQLMRNVSVWNEWNERNVWATLTTTHQTSKSSTIFMFGMVVKTHTVSL